MKKSQEANMIAYQDILKAKSYLLELKEWHEALHFMNHFLDSDAKRNPQEMKACAEMFEVVYKNFGALLIDTGECLSKIVKSK